MRSPSSLLAGSLVVLGCAAGCAGGGDAEEVVLGDRLQGIWQVEASARACGNLYAFYGEKFEMVSYCDLGDGRVWAEKYEGTYVLTEDSEALLTVTRSSCANATRQSWVRVDFVERNLMLTTPSDAVMLEPATHMAVQTGSGRVEFGCLDSEGRFLPGPVRDL